MGNQHFERRTKASYFEIVLGPLVLKQRVQASTLIYGIQNIDILRNSDLHASTRSKKIGMDTNESKALLIRCLQDHIASLQKQLDEKQIII